MNRQLSATHDESSSAGRFAMNEATSDGWDGWTIDPVRRVLAIENRSQSQKRLSMSESANFRSMGIGWRIRRMNRASSKLILPALRRGDRRRILEVPRIRESVPH